MLSSTSLPPDWLEVIGGNNLDQAMKDKLEKFLHRKEILKELRRLAAAGQKSLVVEFEQLLEFDMELSKALLEGPNDFLEASDAVLTEITKLPGMRLRVKGLDKSTVIRDIRAAQVGKFIQVEGILTRSSEVKPEVKEAVFKCLRCGELNHVMQIDEVFREPLICENPNCNMRGPFKMEVESSEFRDWQSVRIQERPESLRGGRMPRQLDCIIKDDFVDKAVPGNHMVASESCACSRRECSGSARQLFEKSYSSTTSRSCRRESRKPSSAPKTRRG